MNSLISKYRKNSSSQITGKPSEEIVNAYAKPSPNLMPNYFNQEKTRTQQTMNNLLQKKYGTDPSAYLEQNKAILDYQNALNASDQYKQVINAERQALGNVNIAREQAEKYMPSQLQQAGMSNVGASESTMAGIQNTYARNVKDVNLATNQEVANLYRDYNTNKIANEQSLREGQFALGVEQENRKKEELNSLLSNASSLKDIEQIKRLYGKTINSSEYNKLMFDKQEKEIALNELANDYASAQNSSDLEIILNKYKNYLDNSDIANLESVIEATKEQEMASNYGVEDVSTAIPVESANTLSFGKFAGSGNNGVQDKWILSILDKARNGEIKNGEVVNFNYGAGKKANYVYYNGKFYKTNLKTPNYEVKAGSNIK
jgi:hypothetical protein